MSDRDLLVRLYGDSLSLPRAADGIGFFDTYAELMRHDLEAAGGGRVTVFNRAVGGATIAELYQSFVQDREYLGGGVGDVVIIQCGIVDCAPRPIPPSLKRMIGRLPPPLRWPIVRGLHHARPYLLRAGVSWRSTAADSFEALLRRWVAEAAGQCARVYVVNIAPTVPAIASHSPGLAASIMQYNECIARAAAGAPAAAVRLIDVHGAIGQRGEVADCVNAADGHHISRTGHRLYADLILDYERERLGIGAGNALG